MYREGECKGDSRFFSQTRHCILNYEIGFVLGLGVDASVVASMCDGQIQFFTFLGGRSEYDCQRPSKITATGRRH